MGDGAWWHAGATADAGDPVRRAAVEEPRSVRRRHRAVAVRRSLLDVAPYMYDAWDPRLTLLGGGTGNDSFHDWIYLFESVGQLRHARGFGAFTHALGVGLVLLALAWAAGVLRLQRRRPGGNVLIER